MSKQQITEIRIQAFRAMRQAVMQHRMFSPLTRDIWATECI
jgi:hypothetical protein